MRLQSRRRSRASSEMKSGTMRDMMRVERNSGDAVAAVDAACVVASSSDEAHDRYARSVVRIDATNDVSAVSTQKRWLKFVSASAAREALAKPSWRTVSVAICILVFRVLAFRKTPLFSARRESFVVRRAR